MKKNNVFLLIGLVALLFSCGGGETSINNQSSDEIGTSQATTSDNAISSINTSTSNQEISSFNELEILVNETIGNREKLLTHFQNIDSKINEYRVEKTTTNSYGTSKSIYEYLINNNETYKKENSLNETNSITETITEYSGLINDTVYYLYKNDNDSSFDKVTRNRYENLNEANEIINNAIKNNSFINIVNNNSQGFGNVFDANSKEISYRITIDEGVTLRSKLTYSTCEILLIANFDLNLNIIDISFTKNGYTSANWDEEKNSPIVSSDKSFTHEYIISNVTYGKKTVEETFISFDGYFIESLSGTVNIFTTYVDTMTLKAYNSQGYNLYINSLINTLSLFESGLTYYPSTALDKESIKITSSSNHNAVYQNQYGTWATGSTSGEKATLQIGNDYNLNMLEIEVEIIKFSIPSSDLTSGENIPVGSTISQRGILNFANYSYIMTNSISIQNSTKTTFGLPTDNEGPFTNLDEIQFNYSNEEIVKITVSELNYNLSGYSAWNVYFDIEGLKVGETDVDITLNNSILWTLKIIVK